MGFFDVPAVIDKIISVTGQRKIYYFGYSMGTTQIMVLLSERPEYNDKIKLVFMWAPAGVLYGATSPLQATGFLTLNVNKTVRPFKGPQDLFINLVFTGLYLFRSI